MSAARRTMPSPSTRKPSFSSGNRQRSWISSVLCARAGICKFARLAAQDLDGLGIVDARAIAGLVSVVALAVLLPETPRVVQARNPPGSTPGSGGYCDALALCTLTPTSTPAMSNTARIPMAMPQSSSAPSTCRGVAPSSTMRCASRA